MTTIELVCVVLSFGHSEYAIFQVLMDRTFWTEAQKLAIICKWVINGQMHPYCADKKDIRKQETH